MIWSSRLCRVCRHPSMATHQVNVEVRWSLCTFHAVSAANCGFRVHRIGDGQLLTQAEAMKMHLNERTQASGR